MRISRDCFANFVADFRTTFVRVSRECRENSLVSRTSRELVAKFLNMFKNFMRIFSPKYFARQSRDLFSKLDRTSRICRINVYSMRLQRENVQVGKDQEKAQSEKVSHSKNRGGKKPNQQPGTYTMKHIVSRMSSYFPNRWPLSSLNLTKNMKTYIRRQQHKKF